MGERSQFKPRAGVRAHRDPVECQSLIASNGDDFFRFGACEVIWKIQVNGREPANAACTLNQLLRAGFVSGGSPTTFWASRKRIQSGSVFHTKRGRILTKCLLKDGSNVRRCRERASGARPR